MNTLKVVIDVTRDYCFDLYNWKNKFELKKHYLISSKSVCPRCNLKVELNDTIEGYERSVFCTNCQILYKR